MNMAGGPTIMAQPRRWDVISGFMLEQGYKTFVEVGCKEGRTTGHVLKTVPDSRVVAIDPWKQMPQQKGVQGGETYEEWDFEAIKKQFIENVDVGKDRCTMLKMTSEEASAFTFMGEFDCIFIDAAHDYENVKKDIVRWWPHVREGGMLVGHDFNHKWPGVERAVADMFNLMHVGCAPDSIWFLIKHPSIELKA